MIDTKIIKHLEEILLPMANQLQKDTERELEEEDYDPTQKQFVKIINYLYRLSSNYLNPEDVSKAEFDSLIKEFEELKIELKKANYALKRHTIVQEEYNSIHAQFYKVKSRLESLTFSSNIEQIACLSDDQPDILNLLTLINTFNLFARCKISPNITSKFYNLKDYLLHHLKSIYDPDKTITLPSSDRNAKSVTYFAINLGEEGIQLISYHSLSRDDKNYTDSDLYWYLQDQLRKQGINPTQLTEKKVSSLLYEQEPNADILNSAWTLSNRANTFNQLQEQNFLLGKKAYQPLPTNSTPLQKTHTPKATFAGGGSYDTETISNQTPQEESVKKSPPEISKKELDAFLDEPGTIEKLHEAAKTATLDDKEIILALISYCSARNASKKQKRTTPKKRGGPAHE